MGSTRRLRIRFPAPGGYWGDARLKVLLDSIEVYYGSAKAGFDVTVDWEPGPHVLRTLIRTKLGTREKEFALDNDADDPAAPALIEARLRYSRLWGNFKSKLEFSSTG